MLGAKTTSMVTRNACRFDCSFVGSSIYKGNFTFLRATNEFYDCAKKAAIYIFSFLTVIRQTFVDICAACVSNSSPLVTADTTAVSRPFRICANSNHYHAPAGKIKDVMTCCKMASHLLFIQILNIDHPQNNKYREWGKILYFEKNQTFP